MQLLPPEEPPLVPGGAPLVISTRDDVLAILPPRYKRAISAAVRDALADSLLALLKGCQYQGALMAAELDIGRSTEQNLDAGTEERGYVRGDSETDPHLRTRTFASPGGISHNNIRDAINAVLAPFTPVQCKIWDSILDRWYVGGNGARARRSFLGRTPSYPSRFFEHDAPQNGGIFVLGAGPTSVSVCNDVVGRRFFVKVPDLTGLNSTPAFTRKAAVATAPIAWFVGTSAHANLAGFVGQSASALSVYQAVINTVHAIVGHSIRWVLIADPNLT